MLLLLFLFEYMELCIWELIIINNKLLLLLLLSKTVKMSAYIVFQSNI